MSPVWHDPYEEQWEMQQREAVRYSNQQPLRGSTPLLGAGMPRPNLSPGDRVINSEGIVPGENQYFRNLGIVDHPSVAEISEGQWRDMDYTGSSAIVPVGGRFTTGEGTYLNRPAFVGQEPSFGGSDDPGLDPDIARRRFQSPQIQALLDTVQSGRSAIGALRPSFGKTEAIVGAAGLSPVSLAMSPLTALNRQTTTELNKRGFQAFNLIGHPGHGEDDTAWQQVHRDFREAVNEAWDPIKKVWKEGMKPVVGVMSMEKFGSLDPRRGLGQFLGDVGKRALMPITIDEAQEIGRGGRLMVKKIADVAKGIFPSSPVQLLGGTITKSQEGMLSNLFGVAPGDIQRAAPSLGHLDVSMENVSMNEYQATGGRFAAEARGGQFIYGYSTKLVDQVSDAASEAGRDSFRYHKGLGATGELMSQEELASVEAMWDEETNPGGIGANQTFGVSPAAGLGLNVKGLESVAQIGAARPSDVIQRALRVRPGRLPTGEQDLQTKVGEFRFAADPRQYSKFAERAVTNVQAMTAPRLARAYQAATAEPWSKNWRMASQEIDLRLGKSLAQQTGLAGMEFTGGDASRILQEAGMLDMQPEVDPQTGETYQNFVATGRGMNIGEIADRIQQGSFQSEFDPNVKGMRFRDFRTEIADVASREYRAMGSIVQQTSGLSPKRAGQFLEQGLGMWASAGGKTNPTAYDSLHALEDFAETTLPKSIADDYVKSVEKASAVFNSQVQEGTRMTEAMKGLESSLTDAQGMLKGSPAAGAIAGQTLMASGVWGGAVDPKTGMPTTPGGAAYAMGAQKAWDVANAPPPAGGGGRGGGFRGGGNMLRSAGSLGGLLYGAYLGSRFWRMFAEPSIQAMGEYGAMEEALQPLYMEGEEFELTGAARMRGEYEQTRMNLGRGAYQMMSPIMGGMYRATQDPATARAMSTLGIGAGVLAGGVIGSQVMGMMASYTAGSGIVGAGAAAGAAGIAAGALPIAGAVIGAGVLGYGGYREWQIQQEQDVAFLEANPQYIGSPTIGMGITGSLQEQLGRMRAGDPMPTDYQGRIPTSQRAGTGLSLREIAKRDWLATRDVTGLAQRMAEEGGFAAEMTSELVPLMYSMGTSGAGEILPGTPAWQDAIDIAQRASTLGVGAAEYYASGAGYAESFGAAPGTGQYHQMLMEFSQMSQADQFGEMRDVGVVNQYASQLAPFIGTDKARDMVRDLDLRDQISTGRVGAMLQDYRSRFGEPTAPMQRGRGRFARAYNVGDTAGAMQLGRLAMSMSPQQQALVQSVVGQFADAGVVASGGQYAQAMEGYATATAGFTPAQMDLGGAIMGGDMRAQAFAAWNDPSVLEGLGLPTGAPSKMYNQFGNPIYQTSGRDFMMWGKSLLGTGLESAQGFAGLAGQRISVETAADWLNVGPEMAQAFYEGGTIGAQQLNARRGIATARAGLGVQMQQILSQERFLWGGGEWTGKPAPGSMWFLQDQMRGLQHQSQMAEFAYTTERMETSNQFAIRQEGLSLERMQTTQAQQRWQFGFQAGGMALQQRWTREDWEFNEQTRALNWEWGQEDINEAIRMSSGRERKQLIKQRERMGIMHGREDERIDEQKQRQEQLWAREEEQYDKQVEYAETLMDLDQDQFDLNVESRETLFELDKENLERRIEDYEKQHELQDKIIKLQRDHQAEQLALSKAALGIQAQALNQQEEMLNVMENSEPVFDKVEDELNMISQYGSVKNTFMAFRTMAQAVDEVSVSKVNRLIRLLNALK
jgi:hypothetical protein